MEERCFSTRPADSSVSEELIFQDWFDWMVEKFNQSEPQQMNRSVPEDEEWFNWLVEESKPEPRQMDGRGMDEANKSTTMSPVCPGPRLSLDERSPAGRSSEEHETISDSLCPEVNSFTFYYLNKNKSV